MNELPDTPAADKTATEQVATDQPCLSCGYNLRTLAVSGVCPECGLAVSETLEHALAHADLDWLKTVKEGTNALAWTSVFVLVLVLVALGLSLVPAAGAASMLIPVLSAQAGFCMYATGTSDLTAREPRAPSGPLWSARRLVRICPALLFLGTGVLLTIALSTIGLAPIDPVRDTLIWLIASLVVATLLLWFTLLAVHGRSLANRVPAPKVAQLAKVTAWIGATSLTVLVACLFAGSVIMAILPHLESTANAVWEMGLSLSLAGFLVLVVFVTVLMFFLRGLLARSIKKAESLPRAGTVMPPPAVCGQGENTSGS